MTIIKKNMLKNVVFCQLKQQFTTQHKLFIGQPIRWEESCSILMVSHSNNSMEGTGSTRDAETGWLLTVWIVYISKAKS